MGNQSPKEQYKKLFDPTTFDLEGHIKYNQFIEENYPLGNITWQINKCSQYILNTESVDDLESYLNKGAHVLALIREIKKKDVVKNNDTALKYYDDLYDKIYNLMHVSL